MSRMFSSAALSRMRRLNESNLRDTCTEQRPNVVTLPGGREEADPVNPWLDVDTYPCRFSEHLTQTERVIADRLAQPVAGVVVIAAGRTVNPANRLVITGTTETSDGDVEWTRTLSVVRVPPFTSAEAMRKLFVAEVV
jgi:hypothetical protein